MRVKVVVAAAVAMAATVLVPSAGHVAVLGDVPEVWPTPHLVERLGPDVPLAGTVLVAADADADRPTLDLLRESLVAGGAARVDEVPPDSDREEPLVVRLRRDPEQPAEGYGLVVRAGEVVITSSDAAGGFHAAQTFRQLVRPGVVPGVRIVDRPALSVRGVVEGFYGPAWTYREALDVLDFSARVKFNEYLYAPKNDPFHRDRWREPYPDERAAELGNLAAAARQRHIRFTYALAPGLSICYSAPADLDAIAAKFRQLHDLGVRSFSLPLDDIDYNRWNCAEDEARYGPPGPANTAEAQFELLNQVQREVLPSLGGTGPLQTVPVEYWGTDDSPYKEAIRIGMDANIVPMWTGPQVISGSITAGEAAVARELWGHETLIWDNYPVNDYTEAWGRLLLGPYGGREPGMARDVVGILGNPMSYAYASQVALFGIADFTWNDVDYDGQRNRRQFADHLAGGDQATADALQVFFDLNNHAPLIGDPPSWQDQAPVLAGEIDRFQQTWDGGDRPGAVAGLRAYAQRIADAPARIRAADVLPGFAVDSGVWLDATELWGQALLATADGLDGNRDRFADSAALAAQAAALKSPPEKNNVSAPVKIGDGVLDAFLTRAPDL